MESYSEADGGSAIMYSAVTDIGSKRIPIVKILKGIGIIGTAIQVYGHRAHTDRILLGVAPAPEHYT